ncbi:SCO3242 family prenyltransferase [Streptomyces litchfieldiae]|uniref:UbiA family prenyltransferase n=1 Tax=Streptomyces litchfieldiae TaxID=3075543 RepID=A0ABU2MLN7_9ACTN|nr:UbiA family prenyltransferase [Streptomyces sp. DSM 44938]MDT0341559.1 UbiA family prenyltransferase [Streptomyces sp. DSM 44938]
MTRAWVELLRGPAALTVPGDLVAGAVTAGGGRPRRLAPAVASSLCLYWAGMALNDWADRDIDARERPERPLPSGRIRPAAAFAAAAGLTATGLALAATGPRQAFATATAIATTVWAYDLGLKHTPAGPAAMATARGLNVLLGAAATGRVPGRALAPAALTAGHTLAVTALSRHEAHGGPRTAPLATLAATAAIGTTLAGRRPQVPVGAGAAAYLLTAVPPLARATRRPSGERVRGGVVAGLQAMVPLQAALAARAGAPRAVPGLLLMLAAARRLSRKVTPT